MPTASLDNTRLIALFPFEFLSPISVDNCHNRREYRASISRVSRKEHHRDSFSLAVSFPLVKCIFEIEMQSYNCPLGKSNIPRALKLSRLNRRMRHDAAFSYSSSLCLHLFPLLRLLQYCPIATLASVKREDIRRISENYRHGYPAGVLVRDRLTSFYALSRNSVMYYTIQ